MKQPETFGPVETTSYPRTADDATFGAIQKMQEALLDETNIVGLARHEPKGEDVQAELPTVVESTRSSQTEADVVAHLAALTVPDELWNKYSPKE